VPVKLKIIAVPAFKVSISGLQVTDSVKSGKDSLDAGDVDAGDVDHNHHNGFPPQEFLLLIAIPTAEAPAPILLALSAIEIPISRFKKQAISVLTFDTLRL